MRPGGFVLVSTPSVENVVATQYPEVCLHYTAYSHISMFTDQSLRRLLAKCGLQTVDARYDYSPASAKAALWSMFYDLDFKSPQHETDFVDSWWVPNENGRRLGCTEGRQPSFPPDVAALVEHLDARVTHSLGQQIDHLYVLARAPGGATDSAQTTLHEVRVRPAGLIRDHVSLT